MRGALWGLGWGSWWWICSKIDPGGIFMPHPMNGHKNINLVQRATLGILFRNEVREVPWMHSYLQMQ